MKTRGIVSALVALGLATTLGGCAGAPVSAPPPTTSPTTSTSAEPTPAPTPSPSPTFVSVRTAWRIHPEGVGPILIGQDYTLETIPLLAERAELKVRDGCVGAASEGWIKDADNVLDPAPNQGVNAGSTAAGLRISVPLAGDERSQGKVTLILPGDAFRTADGLGSGSSMEDVRAAYPAAVDTSFIYGDVLSVAGSNGSWLHFITGPARDGIVDFVELSTRSRPSSEYCG